MKMKKKEILIACIGRVENNCDIYLQMISKAHLLSIDNGNIFQVSCAYIGEKNENKLSVFSKYGAEKIYYCNSNSKIEEFDFCEILEKLIIEIEPEVVIFPSDNIGKSVAAVMATRFGAGLTADVIDIKYENNIFYFFRAAMNDSMIAKIQCINCDIMMCTVKDNSFPMCILQDKNEKYDLVNFDISEYKTNQKLKYKVLDVNYFEKKAKPDINRYQIVFGIGRGAIVSNTIERIVNLSNRIGAGIIGTRAVVESGYIDKDYQVGQSGINISPKLYIAFGISGACQHMVGLKNTGLIIAVNSDEKAPIFEYSDYSICEKIEDVIDYMEKCLKT